LRCPSIKVDIVSTLTYKSKKIVKFLFAKKIYIVLLINLLLIYVASRKLTLVKVEAIN